MEKLKLLNYDDIEDLEKLLYKKIIKNLKTIRERSLKFSSESLDLLDKENFVLSFNVDLTNVHESIEKNPWKPWKTCLKKK